MKLFISFALILSFQSNAQEKSDLVKCLNSLPTPLSIESLKFANDTTKAISLSKLIQPQKIIIKSESRVRKDFPAYFYLAKNPKGIVIYVHGGGCRRRLDLEKMTDIDTLAINKFTFLSGYSVLMLNYATGTNDTIGIENVNKTFSEISNEETCKEVTNIHLQGIKDAISEIRKKYSDKLPIYVLGHSYGGYLVNILSTTKPTISTVNGFISYAGIWDTGIQDDYGKSYHASSALNPINDIQNAQSNLLVIHSQDDTAVSFVQFSRFKDIEPIFRNNKVVRSLELQSGGHFTDDITINKQIMDSIIKFTDETK